MKQDKFQRIRERFDDATDAFSEQRQRMLEDLRFSNPADPQQWDGKIRTLREQQAMPCYTFDQTNQYIAQVVNDSRMNKPQIQTVPASSGADQKVSDALDGMIRQIEYASNAAIAYDVAQEHAARIGRGWMRVLPEVVDSEYNLQEIRIRPVIDSLSVKPGPYTLPTGEDMTFGFVESRMPCEQYERKYGKTKRKAASWGDDTWEDDDTVRIAEYFEVQETKTNNLVIEEPPQRPGDPPTRMTMPEADYWALVKQVGFKPQVVGSFQTTKKTVEWSKLNGDDFVEDSTEFPSKWVPLIPVHGYEIWIEGKRFLCGMVRRMRDGQMAYNIERSSEIHLKALQPKAPYLIPFEAVEGHEPAWGNANTGNPSYLPYNAFASDGTTALPAPTRIAPPMIGTAYTSGSMQARSDLEASIGMFAANLGKQGNETSGIAIKRREQQGDTANFHYIDNLSRSMGHLGRIVIDMIPKLYADSDYGPRDARTLGIEGKSGSVVIDADLPKASMQAQDGTVHINPTTGSYDVRVKVGPAYANLREELSARLSEMSRGNPQLGAALAPLLTQMMDMPESEKVSKICLALLPPNVQQAYNEDGKPAEIPPEVQAQLQQAQQMVQQLHGALQNAAQQHDAAEQELKSRREVEVFKAQALAQREADKHQRELEFETLKAHTSIQIQSMKDATAHLTAEIAAMSLLLSKQIQPPPQVVAEASKETA